MAEWQKIDISSSTIFRAVLILLGFWFLYLIRDILLILFAAVVISWTIEPLANRLQRFKIPRAVTVLLVYVSALTILSGVVSLLVPVIVSQIQSLAQILPAVVSHVEDWIRVSVFQSPAAVAQVQDLLTKFGDNLANIGVDVFARTRSVFSGIVSLLFVFVITFYLVLEREPLKKLFRILLPPEHHPYVEGIIDKARTKIGRWVRAQLILGIIVGSVVGISLWLLGVPFALLLGVIAGILEIIPTIGPVLAAVPGVIIGFSQGWVLGLVTLVLYWLVQQLENHILVPNIMRRAVGLNPLVTLIAVLLGARLIGVVGIILAVPAATILSIFLLDVFGSEEEKPG